MNNTKNTNKGADTYNKDTMKRIFHTNVDEIHTAFLNSKIDKEGHISVHDDMLVREVFEFIKNVNII